MAIRKCINKALAEPLLFLPADAGLLVSVASLMTSDDECATARRVLVAGIVTPLMIIPPTSRGDANSLLTKPRLGAVVQGDSLAI
jgi:hypothetical protein